MRSWLVMLAFLCLLTAAFSFGEIASPNSEAALYLIMFCSTALVGLLPIIGLRKMRSLAVS
jgi:hypothetical protein